MQTTILNYRVIVEPDTQTGTDKPGFTALCPTLGVADDGDTVEELNIIRDSVVKEGVRFAVSDHWLKGGEGALELAQTVKEACEEPHDFLPLYDHNLPFRAKVKKIAKSPIPA